MADGATTLAAVTRSLVTRGFLKDAASTRTPFYWWMEKHGRIVRRAGGSTHAPAALIVKQSTNTKPVARYQANTVAAIDPGVKLSYTKMRYTCPISVDRQDLRDCRGDAEIASHMEAMIMASQMDITGEIGVDLIKSNGPLDTAVDKALRIGGLEQAINSAVATGTGTVGGIDVSTQANFRPQYDAAFGSFATNWKDIMTTWIACCQGKGMVAPDLGLMRPLVWQWYFNALQPYQRYEDVETANAGWPNLTFMKQTPFIWDDSLTNDAQAGYTLMLLHTPDLQLWVDEQADFYMDEKWDNAKVFGQDAWVNMIIWAGQLEWSNLRNSGIIYGITV